MDSKALLKDIEANAGSRTWRVSDKLSISQSSVVCHLHDLSKSTWSWQIVPYVILREYQAS